MWRWVALFAVKVLWKIAPAAAAAAWWHYRPADVLAVAVEAGLCVALGLAAVAVALRVRAVYRAACIRRGQQLGIYRDPDPLLASARMLRMHAVGREDR